MRYTAYKFDPSYIKTRLDEYKKNLRENSGPDTDFVKNALAVIQRRLDKDPWRYRDYGPYWWALKKLFIANQLTSGNIVDEDIAKEYCGSTPGETIVMAEEFREDYLGKFFVYTNKFDLGPANLDDDEAAMEWILHDPDMEEPT